MAKHVVIGIEYEGKGNAPAITKIADTKMRRGFRVRKPRTVQETYDITIRPLDDEDEGRIIGLLTFLEGADESKIAIDMLIEEAFLAGIAFAKKHCM